MFVKNFFNKESKNTVNNSITSNPISQNLNKNEINLDINNANKMNKTIEFLIKMNNSKLTYELYGFMNKQMIIYNKYDEYRVLELTNEQFKIFNNYNISLDMFKQEPFKVDAVVVYEQKSLQYKYFDTKENLERMNLIKTSCSKIESGLEYLTSNIIGYLGYGLYVCDNNDDESGYLFNNLIADRLRMLSRNSNRYIHSIVGKYSGLVKRCVYGDLSGVYILLDGINEDISIMEEELELYGEIEEYPDRTYTDKTNELSLKIQESMPDLNISFNENIMYRSI